MHAPRFPFEANKEGNVKGGKALAVACIAGAGFAASVALGSAVGFAST